MCIRNAVLGAWTTLEMARCHALGIQKLGGRKFQEANQTPKDLGGDSRAQKAGRAAKAVKSGVIDSLL
jgi:hypothetical protein